MTVGGAHRRDDEPQPVGQGRRLAKRALITTTSIGVTTGGGFVAWRMGAASYIEVPAREVALAIIALILLGLYILLPHRRMYVRAARAAEHLADPQERSARLESLGTSYLASFRNPFRGNSASAATGTSEHQGQPLPAAVSMGERTLPETEVRAAIDRLKKMVGENTKLSQQRGRRPEPAPLLHFVEPIVPNLTRQQLDAVFAEARRLDTINGLLAEEELDRSLPTQTAEQPPLTD